MEGNPIDLSVSQPNSQTIPEEITETLNWGTLSDPDLENVKEEFRITLTSASIPYHIFRVVHRKKVRGESILYWPKELDLNHTIAPQRNMEEFLSDTCKEIHQTENYEYCIPELSKNIDWSPVYNMLVQRNIWTLPDETDMQFVSNESSNPWEIYIQTRYQNYYHSYNHTNPDQYGGNLQALDLLAITAQMRQIASSFTPAQNFNTYQGITTGIRGSDFIPCDIDEVWRFNARLDELIAKNGITAQFEGQDSLLFFVNVQGSVEDEWYAQRESSGYSKVITPVQINNIELVKSVNCPNSK